MKVRILLFAALLLAACSKNESVPGTTVTGPVESFDQLQTSSNFDWSTEAEYKLQLQGLKTLPFAKVEVLNVYDLEQNLLHRAVVEISQNRTLKFEAPAGLEFFKVEFGTIAKEVSINANRASFDFLPIDDTSDLDPEDQ